uniref:Uncharacterized protein n=1 Tax=Cacopsylla melanoneura TaxID=428564 RepID=A0A8D8LRV1_9HEMI
MNLILRLYSWINARFGSKLFPLLTISPTSTIPTPPSTRSVISRFQDKLEWYAGPPAIHQNQLFSALKAGRPRAKLNGTKRGLLQFDTWTFRDETNTINSIRESRYRFFRHRLSTNRLIAVSESV